MAVDPDTDERATLETDLRRQLTDVYSERPWVVAGEIVQAAVGLAAQVSAAGAERVLAVGAGRGVGTISDEVEYVCIERSAAGSAMDGIRAANAVLHEPPDDVVDAVQAFDPQDRARTIVDFTIGAGTVCGRPTFGARPQAWELLEDKMVTNDIWRGAGVRAAPAEVVGLDDRTAVIETHRRLASWEGTVWAVDNEAGWHGGAHGTFWIPDSQRAAKILDQLDPAHRRVRIMPFVDGTPCSIHGMVIGDTTIAFRPMESLVYRDRAGHRFVYAKASSFWDPPQPRRDEMRSAARAVGDELRRRVGYQGVFTVDGVLARSGFSPTEVNTRFGGALPMAMQALDGEPINLFLLHLAAIEDRLDVDPARFEAWVTANLDARRLAVGFFETGVVPDQERSLTVSLGEPGALSIREGDSSADGDLATISWGTKGQTGMLRIVGTQAFPTGPATAPLLLDLARLADAHWHVGLAALEPPAAE